MKIQFLLLIYLCFIVSLNAQSKYAVIKANILRGTPMVTPKMDASDLEEVVAAALKQNNIKRINTPEQRMDKKPFFVDIFAFQEIGSNPVVVLTIRSDSGLHYIDRKSVALFGNRKKAILKLTNTISGRLPTTIDTSTYYAYDLREMLYGSRQLRKLPSPLNNSNAFLFPGQFNDYLNQTVSLWGTKKAFKTGDVTITFQIDELGRMKVKKLDAPVTFTQEQKKQFANALANFPLWVTDGISTEEKFVLSRK